MKALFSLLVLVLIPFFLDAQNLKDRFRQASDKQIEVARQGELNLNELAIQIMPLSFFNRRSRFRFGILYATRKMSYVLDLEYGRRWMPSLVNKENIIDNFYGIRPEVRFHLPSPRLGQSYIGIEVPFNISELSLEAKVYEENGSFFRFDSAIQKRVRVSGILKIGQLVYFSERLYADFYIGGGYGNRNISYADEVNKQVTTEPPTEEFFIGSDRFTPGNSPRLEFALGCRIGFQLH